MPVIPVDAEAPKAPALEPAPASVPGARVPPPPPSRPSWNDGDEILGSDAIRRIVRALPPVERAYAQIRFLILRSKLLATMDLLLPDEGRILDVGCGFGLFASYFGQVRPGRTIFGVDPDARRIGVARDVATKLGQARHTFQVGDVRDVVLGGQFDGAYILDVMHHIPKDQQIPVLQRMRDLLVPGGVLVMKDVTTTPRPGLLFTEYLDRLMVGWNEPLAYRHHHEWREILMGLGFKVKMARVPDVLPYPHVILAGTKLA